MLSPDEFNEAAYLEINGDVDQALRDGVFENAYEHYRLRGFFEKRGHGGVQQLGDGLQMFTNLIGSLNDLRTTANNRAPQIEHLNAARAVRAAALARRGER